MQEAPCCLRAHHTEKEVPVAALPPAPLTLPHNGALLLRQVQASSCTPSAVLHCSRAAPGCSHTAAPRPLPGTDLQSPRLGAQPLPACLRLRCARGGTHHLFCPPQSGCCTFLGCSEAPPPSQPISHPLGGLLTCGSLSSSVAPSQECRPSPDSFSSLLFFFLLSYVEVFLPFLNI